RPRSSAVAKSQALTGSLGRNDAARRAETGLGVSSQAMRRVGAGGRGAYDERMTTTELAQTIQDRLDVLHREIDLLEAARDQLRSNRSGSGAPPVHSASAAR